MKGLDRSLSRGPHPIKQHFTRHTIKIEDLVVSVSAVAAAAGLGTAVIGDLPEGNILVAGGVVNLAFAGTGSDANLVDAWEGDFGVGSAPDADGSLAGAEVDLIGSTELTAVAEVTPITRGINDTQAMLDNTDGSLEINLNLVIDAADITDDQSVNITINGIIEIVYMVILDD